jgi:hypothetical protein
MTAIVTAVLPAFERIWWNSQRSHIREHGRIAGPPAFYANAVTGLGVLRERGYDRAGETPALQKRGITRVQQIWSLHGVH